MENYKPYLRLRAILMAAWDPCGIAESGGCYDEYDVYIPEIYELAMTGQVHKLTDFLHHVETDSMGRTDWREIPAEPRSNSYHEAASMIVEMYHSKAEYPTQRQCKTTRGLP